MPTECSKCQMKIEAGDEYQHLSSVLCEECWMDVRVTRTRKTHLQYLKSIKTEYLIPAKKELK